MKKKRKLVIIGIALASVLIGVTNVFIITNWLMNTALEGLGEFLSNDSFFSEIVPKERDGGNTQSKAVSSDKKKKEKLSIDSNNSSNNNDGKNDSGDMKNTDNNGSVLDEKVQINDVNMIQKNNDGESVNENNQIESSDNKKNGKIFGFINISLPNPAKIISESIVKKMNVNVDTNDYNTAYQIVSSKLSLSEMKMLYDVAKDGKYKSMNPEEKKKIKEFVYTKFTSEEIDTLRKIASKYGK